MNNGITTEEEKFIDAHDLKNRFPEECKRLPFEYLDEKEKIIAEKCINQEQLTDQEFQDLKKLLADYRPFLSRYDVIQLEENIDENIKTIKSSSELLQVLEDPDRYRFDMHYKVNNQLMRLQFRLKPVSDTEYIELLDAQTKIFKDLDKNEKIVYSKYTNGQEISPEESKMIQHIQDKIVEKYGDIDKNNDTILDFLVNHVELLNDTTLSYEERLHFWSTMDLGTRTLVYNKCKNILKIDEELEVDLFPSLR